MVVVYNFKSFFDDNSSKKRTAQTYRLVLKYFRFTTDLQTPLDLKVRVDNHILLKLSNRRPFLRSSPNIFYCFNFYVTPNFARVYEIRISSPKNIQERDDSGVSLATLNCETFILYKKIIQE